MSLQTVLEELPKELRLPFLRKAYRSERQDVAEALLSELKENPRRGPDCYKEFDQIIGTLIRQAKKSGDTKRESDLEFRRITSCFYTSNHTGNIEAAAKKNGNPDLISRVIDHYRQDHWCNWEMVMNLLEHLGREGEAREYALEVIQVLDEKRKSSLRAGGKWANHSVDSIYMRLGMFREAVEVKLDNKDFDEAIRLAQEHLSEEELPQLYQRVFDAAEGEGYENGFPVQVRAAKLLGDEELERTTKKKYVDFVMAKGEGGYLDLIREAGTEQQLRETHERIVAFHQQYDFYRPPKSLAKAAGEAYRDTQQVKYAGIALEAYEKIGDLPKTLEFARITDPKKAEVLEMAVSLMME